MLAILGLPRISENKVRWDDKILYSFGLNKENSLKRPFYKYISNFGNEKGLLNILF